MLNTSIKVFEPLYKILSLVSFVTSYVKKAPISLTVLHFIL